MIMMTFFGDVIITYIAKVDDNINFNTAPIEALEVVCRWLKVSLSSFLFQEYKCNYKQEILLNFNNFV